MVVVKRSGHREPFDRAKIVAGVRSASKTRPVALEQMQALAADVEESLRLEGPELSSQQIGLAVLDRLRVLDEVVYLRFASVYKEFAAAGDFEREAGLLNETGLGGDVLSKETEPKQPS